MNHCRDSQGQENSTRDGATESLSLVRCIARFAFKRML